MDDSSSDQISEVELQWLRKHAPELLVDNDKNFRSRDQLEPSDPNDDPEANDPEAKRRRTQKEVRHDLIRRTFIPALRDFRRTATEAVRQIKQDWKDHFGVELHESTIYRALNLRPPAQK